MSLSFTLLSFSVHLLKSLQFYSQYTVEKVSLLSQMRKFFLFQLVDLSNLPSSIHSSDEGGLVISGGPQPLCWYGRGKDGGQLGGLVWDLLFLPLCPCWFIEDGLGDPGWGRAAPLGVSVFHILAAGLLQNRRTSLSDTQGLQKCIFECSAVCKLTYF